MGKAAGACSAGGRVTKEGFRDHLFGETHGEEIGKSNDSIIQKLEEISQITSRRYEDKLPTYMMAVKAAQQCLSKAHFDPEMLDGIIVAHNFGDFGPGDTQGHMIPNLAAKVKHGLAIKNSKCFAFDVLFGCPGWLQAMDQGHQYIQNGVADALLIIGVDSLSRVIDPNDMDGMLFGDGAGATLITAQRSSENESKGQINYNSRSDCNEELDFLCMKRPIIETDGDLRISMNGKGVFKYALETLPMLIKETLEEVNIPIEEVGLFLFHQANGKMIEALGSTLSKLHNHTSLEGKLPIILQELGNTSVATIPTLLDKIMNKEMNGYQIHEGDLVVFASVGAGMHANVMVYRF
jgi:3-oxoacyl-[acyl-carrier-protein] synthase-3